MRTTSAAISGLVLGRPSRLAFEPSYCWATRRRYHRRIVSGVTMPATAARRRRPRTLPFTARRRQLVVGETQTSGSVHRAEHPILLEQIVNDRLLLSVDPTGEQQEEERERRRQRGHGGSVPEALRRFKNDGDWAEFPKAHAFSGCVDPPMIG